VTAEDLQEMVCGVQDSDCDFEIRDIFRVVVDAELETCQELSTALWQVLDTWPPGLKRKFVRFVTGSERLPLPGSELLRIELPFVAFSTREQKKTLGMLPQAHTCENILELPNYWEALCGVRGEGGDPASLVKELGAVIEARLTMAIEHCTEYDLDGTGSVAGAIVVEPATSGIQMSSSMVITSTNVSWSPPAAQRPAIEAEVEASDEVMSWEPSPVSSPEPMQPAQPLLPAARQAPEFQPSAGPPRISTQRPSPAGAWGGSGQPMPVRQHGYSTQKSPDEEKDVDLLLQELDLDI